MTDLDTLGLQAGSIRSSTGLNLLSAYEGQLARYRDDSFTLLDVTAEPEIALPVWRSYFPRATVTGIYSLPVKAGSAPPEPEIASSRKFGREFWLDLARKHAPTVAVVDGSQSALHQKEMFSILYPVLQPGGTVLFDDCWNSNGRRGGAKHAGTAHLFNFLASVARGLAGDPPAALKNDEFFSYCVRTVAAVEITDRFVAVRKKIFPQARFEAVPFRELATDHRQLDHPAPYPRPKPLIFGSGYIARRVDTMLENQADVPPPPAEVGRLADAVMFAGGILAVGNRYIVEESLINQRHTARRGPLYQVAQSELHVSEGELAPVEDHHSDRDYVAVKQTWDANYGHWLVDTLPRVINVQETMQLHEPFYVVSAGPSDAVRKLHAETLALVGVSTKNLLHLDHRPVHFESLIYATPMTIPPLVKSQRCIAVLESLASRLQLADQPTARPAVDKPRKLYLSRNRYTRRRLINEEAIIPLLTARGYEVIHPETLSVGEQMAIFSAATHVVGNMGAAFSNVVFSPRTVKVFVLATETMMHDYFYDIVCHKSGNYVALQGSAGNKDEGLSADFTVDVDEFARILADFDTADDGGMADGSRADDGAAAQSVTGSTEPTSGARSDGALRD
ncbi:MAG: hypothetical protein JWO93_2863 [Micrococcaceae bacterium]|nr:hypothetical protein [Micrococcaceae bacterium]